MGAASNYLVQFGSGSLLPAKIEWIGGEWAENEKERR